MQALNHKIANTKLAELVATYVALIVFYIVLPSWLAPLKTAINAALPLLIALVAYRSWLNLKRR